MTWFGRLDPVAGFPAEQVGLPGYGARRDWEDEAAALIGDIATRGYRHATLARVQAHDAALKTERKARLTFERCGLLARVSGKRRALGRTLVGATAARLATEEAHRKLHLLAFLIPELAR